MADEKEKILKILMEYVTDKQSVAAAKSALKDIEKSIDGTKDKLKGLTKALDDDLAKGAKNATGKMEALDKAGMALEKTGRLIGGTWGEALAGIGGGIGDVTAAIEQLKEAKALLGGLGGAGGAGGLGALGVGAAGLLGVGAGAAGYEGLRALGIAKGASLGQFASVAAYGAGKVFGDDTAQKWFKSVAEALGELPAPAQKATQAIKGISQAAGAIDPNQIRYAAVQSNREVSLPTGGMRVTSLSGARRYAQSRQLKEISEAEKDFQFERAKIIRDARIEQEQAEKEHWRKMNQQVIKFNQEAEFEEENHNTAMKRMQEDQDRALNQLAQDRNAVGYLQQWDAGRTQQARAEEDFQTQQAQKRALFEEDLRQQQQDYLAEKDLRRQAADRQMEDLRIQLDRETAAKKEAYDQSLSHANDFVNNMRSLFSQLSYGHSLTSQINKQIGQTLG